MFFFLQSTLNPKRLSRSLPEEGLTLANLVTLAVHVRMHSCSSQIICCRKKSITHRARPKTATGER
jgi:hypothetical protein